MPREATNRDAAGAQAKKKPARSGLQTIFLGGEIVETGSIMLRCEIYVQFLIWIPDIDQLDNCP
jgi:hypothetical protein